MYYDSYLKHELETAKLKAQYDSHARRLLKDKGVLAYILKYAVKEFNNYSLEEAKACIVGEPEVAAREVSPSPEAITGMDTECYLPGEGKTFYDIVFTAITKDKESHKLYVNLEAQKDFYPGYDLVTRGVIYAARLLSQQMDTEYTSQNYDGAKKVYSIWICMDPPRKNKDRMRVADSIMEYSLTPKVLFSRYCEENVATGRYDLLSVVFVCLQYKGNASANKLIGMLSTLFSDIINVAEKKNMLEKDYDLPMSHEMEGEAAAMCNLSDNIAWEKDIIIENNIKKIREMDTALKDKDEENKKLVEEVTKLREQIKNIEENLH